MDNDLIILIVYILIVIIYILIKLLIKPHKTKPIKIMGLKVGEKPWKEKKGIIHRSLNIISDHPYKNLTHYIKGRKVRFWKIQNDDDSEGYAIPIFYRKKHKKNR